ncbi:hypothetical protein N203_07710 [Helicobacter pylori UM084]|nr:hypothetical protein N203_07710 [Helicobacter pylori UM084]
MERFLQKKKKTGFHGGLALNFGRFYKRFLAFLGFLM